MDYLFQVKPTRCTLFLSTFVSTSLQVSDNAVLCNVMLRRVPCYGCAFCASLHASTQRSEINVTFYIVTLARTIWLPDDGPRTETCRSVFNVLMCKFYICAVVGIIIK